MTPIELKRERVIGKAAGATVLGGVAAAVILIVVGVTFVVKNVIRPDSQPTEQVYLSSISHCGDGPEQENAVNQAGFFAFVTWFQENCTHPQNAVDLVNSMPERFCDVASFARLEHLVVQIPGNDWISWQARNC
jgi:hypothetical protein